MKLHSAIAIVALALLGYNAGFAQNTAATSVDSRVETLQNTPPEKLVNEATYPLEWNMIAEKNIQSNCRIWRELELLDQHNQSIAKLDKGGKNLAEVLIAEAMKGTFKIYSASDDRFSKEISVSDLKKILSEIPPNTSSSIHKFRIQENWAAESENKLVARIIGMAPVRQIITKDGTTTEQVLCWFYYPNIQPALRNIPVSIPGYETILNADLFLETRQHTAHIIDVMKYDNSAPRIFTR